jgi:hypothetical protein
MLVIAFAGLNIEQAVIYQTCENVNYSIHLIPQGRECVDMISLEGLTISRLPYNNILLDGCENVRLVKM